MRAGPAPPPRALLLAALSGLGVATGAAAAARADAREGFWADARVLLFWAAGSAQATIDLVKADVEHAREQWPSASVFLAHYDGEAGRDRWQERAGADWYRRNVAASATQKGYKFQILQALVQEGSIDLSVYDWVWVLDEDADFHSTPLDKLLQTAEESGALIATPAFTQPDGSTYGMSYPFQAPRGECRFRYAPVVEVSFPLFRPAALGKLLSADCEHCLHRRSVWGFCRMWCSWSAKQLGGTADKACAVLDQAPIVHRDFHTLPGKYDDGEAASDGFPDARTGPATSFLQAARWGRPGSQKFEAMAMEDYQDVRDHHPDDFVDTPGAQMSESQCM